MTTTINPPKHPTRSGWFVLAQVLIVAIVAPLLLAILARWIFGI